MVQLSVNVNKIATLRNSRGGDDPSVLKAVEICLAAGAPGITVHPRADARHIRSADVREISAFLRDRRSSHGAPPELNIEGDPRPDLLELVLAIRPQQCTLVPVVPGEVTSQAGWSAATEPPDMRGIVARLKDAGVRVSLFIDATPQAVEWAASRGADRVELYTEPYARAFGRGPAAARASFETFAIASTLAHGAGLGVNAGHDLDLRNLQLFRALPHLEEVSIGHALVSRALWVGLDRVVREYLAVLDAADTARRAGAI